MLQFLQSRVLVLVVGRVTTPSAIDPLLAVGGVPNDRPGVGTAAVPNRTGAPISEFFDAAMPAKLPTLPPGRGGCADGRNHGADPLDKLFTSPTVVYGRPHSAGARRRWANPRVTGDKNDRQRRGRMRNCLMTNPGGPCDEAMVRSGWRHDVVRVRVNAD
jgi:hypothetical protein